MVQIRKGDPENARLRNRFLILNKLRKSSDFSRADLARMLGLSKMTVSTIVSDLIDEGFIVEKGEGASLYKGGRKPILLDLNNLDKFVIGVDIGKTNLHIALANLKGELIQKKRIKTPSNAKPITIIKKIQNLSEDILSNCGVKKQSLLGMSVSIGGLINKNMGIIIYSPDFNWENLYFQKMLEEYLGLQVVLDNCTRAMALSEQRFGSSDDIQNLFYVNIGYGIGSSIIMDGRVYDNISEFGHCFITANKGLCHCGKEGCLEFHASGHAIAREAKLRLNVGKLVIDAADVAKMALDGNQEAIDIFNAVGKYLGLAISFAANLYNPEKIIIGGGVSLAGELLMEPLLKEFNLRVMDAIGNTTTIEVSSLGVDAGIKGAIALGLDSFVFQNVDTILFNNLSK